MTEPTLPLPDVPLIIEDLLAQAKPLADAGEHWSVPEKVEAVIHAASSWMCLNPSSYSCGVK